MRSSSSRPPLLEREAAVRRVGGLGVAMARGEGGVLVVESAAGTGKTALLESAADCARTSEALVLPAQGHPLESQFAFGVARQVFERLVSDAPPELSAALLEGPAGVAAAALGVSPAGSAPAPSTESVIHGLFWLAVNLTRDHPVLLIVDDVQWADECSWEWLGYLARRIDGLRLGLIVAGRSEAADFATRRPADLARMRGEDPIRLRPLSRSAVRGLIEHFLGQPPDAEFVGACHELTRGNPFLVVELIRAVDAQVLRPVADSIRELNQLTPDRVAWSVRARLSRLLAPAAIVAESLAVLGHAELVEIAAVARATPAAAEAGLDSLVAAEIVCRDRPFRFVHPLVRQVIYDAIPPGRAGALHRIAARTLAGRAGSPDRVAGHLLNVPVGADEWVARQLLNAARRASDARAFPTAATYLGRAMSEQTPPALRARIVGDLGLAEERLRRPQSIPHLYEATEHDDEAERTAELVRALGRALILEGRVSEGVDVLERGIQRVNGCSARLVWEMELDLQSFARTVPETVARANDRLAALTREADHDPEQARWLDRALVQRPCWEASDWRAAHRRAVERLSAAGRPFENDCEALSNYTAVQALGWCDLFDDALGYLEIAFEAAARHGSITAHVLASTYRAEIHLRKGAFVEAEADATVALELAEEHRLSIPAALALAWLVNALTERGRAADAWSVITARALDRSLPEQHVFAMLYQARALLHAVDGRPDLSLSDALEAGRLLAALGPGPTPLPWRATAALATHRLGRPDEARSLATHDLALARRFGAPRALGIALRTAALVGPGDPTLLLRRSVDTLARSQARGELARSLLELGSAMRRGPRAIRESRAILRESLDIAHRCGAAVVAQRARDELQAAGGRPRRPAARGLESLTARELRVAQLAAAGSTNREIAQALFIAPRTVEHHLRSIFHKLGISSRASLGTELGVGEAGATDA